MSIFTDFQEAWAHRFPGCDLPQAWEDDVRANLDKHKHRVACLQEELEKEEFYVEYLERLLQDVEKAKRSSMSSCETMRSDASGGRQSDECAHEKSVVPNGLSDSFRSTTAAEGGGGGSPVSKDANRRCSDCSSAVQSKVDKPVETDPDPVVSADSSIERPSRRKDNPYVTVIEVNGVPGKSGKQLILKNGDKPKPKVDLVPGGNLESVNGPETRSLEKRNPAKAGKKVPPRPPPKRVRQRQPDQPPEKLNEIFENVCKICETPSVVTSTFKYNFTTFKPQMSVESSKEGCETNGPSSVVTLNVEDAAEGKAKDPPSEPPPQKTSLDGSTLVKNASSDGIAGEALEEEEDVMEEEEEEEENIYDTVPFEYPDTENNCNANSDDKHVTFDEVVDDDDDDDQEDPEGDYVVLSDKSSEHESHDPDSPNYSNYVNIDYFLREKVSKKDQHGISRLESITIEGCCVSDEEEGPSPSLVRSVSSDQELDINGSNSNSGTISSGGSSTGRSKQTHAGKEDAFDVDSGVYSSSVESASFIYTSSPVPPTPPASKSKNDQSVAKSGDDKLEAERLTMYKCILNSIIESETVYVECLTVMLQYMKALKATLTTSQPVIIAEDFNTIFYKIPELHTLHHSFLEGLRDHLEHPEEKPSIADQFKMLAGKLSIYGSFLQNYAKAVDAIRRCNAGNPHFCEITKTIKLKTLKGQVITLEELLHKPVARVQKNALVLHDLLKYTPEDQTDYKTFKSALKLTQCFLNELNMTANEGMFPPADRTQRHLVKNSFIVELTEGHRKLRHLFLFNDVIVCAKYKPSSRQKFTFEVKWYIPLAEILLPNEHDGDTHIRECSSIDVLTLKARASTVREHILREEKLNLTREKPKAAVRNLDKHKKKLSELEAQLVLASPNLIFRIGHKSGKMYTFFVGSEFDRFQWTEALKVLHASALPNPPLLSVMELQAWIASCRQHLGASFLFKSCLDEELLVGTLQISVINMEEIVRPGDLFICFEVDSYGHFFRKAKTKLVHCTETVEWKQDFVIDLEGSQTLRVICYEQQNSDSGKHGNIVIRGKSALELSRNWLGETTLHKKIQLNEMKLSISLKFIAKDYSLKKIALTRTVGVFGMKVNQVCKKEKSNVPLVITNCVNEVERRGMKEVGVYRVSGSASDVQRLKKGFETNVYEAEQMLKELDIHATTGLLKLYLRELPEALFTDLLYPKFFEAFSLSNADQKSRNLLSLFSSLPQINQNVIVYLIDHMYKVHQEEASNKMSLHNLATVFGPTLLRPGSGSIGSSPSDMLAAGTIDVMAQAGILYFFLKRKAAGLPLVKKNTDTIES